MFCQDHHIFAGSGHSTNSRGVAFLIHSRWKKQLKRFTPINERLAYIDIDIQKFKLRIITAYFPHTGYGDQHVQLMYDKLSEIKAAAKNCKRHIIICGDFNAQVGSRSEGESKRTLGNFGFGSSNSRGEWLKAWAGKEQFVITNTHFRKQERYMTTYTSPNNTQHC